MENEGFEDAEYALRDAEEAVGVDSPINRYKVRLLVLRAQKTQGISEGDRLALLRKAYELASRNVEAHKWDKLSYRELCRVAVLLVERGESEFYLEEALAKMREGYDRILDPEMEESIRYFERMRARAR